MKRFLTSLAAGLLLVAGCRDQMSDQPKAEPYERTTHFADGTTDRPLPPGTVTRAGDVVRPPPDQAAYYAVDLPDPVLDQAGFPHPFSTQDIEIGRRVFNINCSMCHGQTGEGNGIVVQRGFPRPPSYYEQRLRDAPPGHIVNVITHGRGAMFPAADRVPMEDRWRVAAYIRALQLSEARVDLPREATPWPDRRKAEVTQ